MIIRDDIPRNNFATAPVLLCISIVTTKQMTALQDAMVAKSADGLAMLNPHFAQKPNDSSIWNSSTGRYDFDRELYGVGRRRDE